MMLPHVLAFNQPAVPEAVTALSRALGSPQGTAITDPARSLWELARELGAPTSLQDLGMKQEDIPPIVRDVLNSSYGNPREVSEESITRIITAAWTGRL
ncbi:hypothetical protein [Corynebacterium casei]|uniref:hypothetical protein n=1 Tax=Corynebacterium casei TaxID=160386 RepID=UPI003BB58AEC